MQHHLFNTIARCRSCVHISHIIPNNVFSRMLTCFMCIWDIMYTLAISLHLNGLPVCTTGAMSRVTLGEGGDEYSIGGCTMLNVVVTSCKSSHTHTHTNTHAHTCTQQMATQQIVSLASLIY